MFVAGAVVLVLFGIVLVVFARGVTRWAEGETAKEAQLHAPDAHLVSYVVPDGEDPALVMAALTHAGFTSVEDTTGRRERVLVECEEEDRDRVRNVIEHVRHRRYDGAAVVDRVTFEDEA
jgi:hypothetical protein